MNTKKVSTVPKGNEINTLLAYDAYLIKRKVSNNTISCKLHNRRVRAIKHENGFSFQFKAIDNNHTPHALCERMREKVVFMQIELSKETAEIVMFSLAEMMGFRIC